MENVIFESGSSLDKGTLRKMWFVFILISLVLAIFLFNYFRNDSYSLIPFSGLLVLYVTILSVGYLNTPVKYYLTKSNIYIKRPRGILSLKLREIKSIREFGEEDKKGLYRVFGSEGAFGSFGIFSSKQHRRFNVYASRDTNWVLIEMRFGKKYVISPDDLQFVEQTNELLTLNDYVN